MTDIDSNNNIIGIQKHMPKNCANVWVLVTI